MTIDPITPRLLLHHCVQRWAERWGAGRRCRRQEAVE